MSRQSRHGLTVSAIGFSGLVAQSFANVVHRHRRGPSDAANVSDPGLESDHDVADSRGCRNSPPVLSLLGVFGSGSEEEIVKEETDDAFCIVVRRQ
jgi:hypothetical protein